MNNKEIAHILGSMARMMYIQDYNPDRIDDFSYASRYIATLSESLADMYKRDRLLGLDRLSSDVVRFLRQLLSGASIKDYEVLKASVPETVVEMFDIPGLGCEHIKIIFNELNIYDVDTLEKSSRRGELRSVAGLSVELEQTILDGIKILKSEQRIKPINYAYVLANDFVEYFKKCYAVEKIEVVGDLRRRVDLIGTVELLVATEDNRLVVEYFCRAPMVREYDEKSHWRCLAVSKDNFNIILRIVPVNRFYSALVHYSGSESFISSFYSKATQIHSENIIITEDGLDIDADSEKAVFDFCSMDYIPPVLREGRGEIEEAIEGSLPDLVELNNIQGDLHVHSLYSDGNNSVALLAERARNMGYEYIGIADHSQSLRVANGLSAKGFKEKAKKIKKLNREYKNFKILCGAEVDIHPDGTLDYPDQILKSADYVIGSVHTALGMSYEEMTERIIKAVMSGRINILGHPTGRLFGVRKAYEFDIDKVMQACAEYGVAMEISAYTNRLDLNDVYAMRAKSFGVKFAIGTDAHYIDRLESMEYGVWTAQRAWLNSSDIINSRSLDGLIDFFEKKV